MKFIMLNGPSCSGKSTIVKNVMTEKEKYYQLSYDAQKRMFSQFAPGRQYQDVRDILRSLAETVCTMQYNIICDSGLNKEMRERLLDVPRRHNYEIIEINLEADYEILEKRFEERVERIINNPTGMVHNTSKERFRELYDMYEGGKNQTAITFRTDQESIEDITEKVLNLM